VIYDVLGRVLQQGAEEGEVRDYPAEGKGITWGGKWRHDDAKMVQATAVRSPGVDTRPRREREGCARVVDEGEKWEEEEEKGAAATGHPFKRARWGGGRSAGGATRR
jgi:hypothetical protein